MNEEFNKGIKSPAPYDLEKIRSGWNSIRLSQSEKEKMLQKIFSAPIKSPYVFPIRTFGLVACLVLVMSVGVLQVSGNSLPGDILYPIKTKIVEPFVGASHRSSEEKIVWEEAKIDRRIAEAEKLVEKDKLDDKKFKKLEESIKKSSQSFNIATEKVASSTSLKKELRARIVEGKKDKEDSREEKGSENSGKSKKEKKERVNKLRDSVVEILDATSSLKSLRNF